MGRTAQLKKTSEERCREAFEKWWSGSFLEFMDADMPHAEIAWTACWQYLEKQVVKEFIEG